jgi:hypothetical protein
MVPGNPSSFLCLHTSTVTHPPVQFQREQIHIPFVMVIQPTEKEEGTVPLCHCHKVSSHHENKRVKSKRYFFFLPGAKNRRRKKVLSVGITTDPHTPLTLVIIM